MRKPFVAILTGFDFDVPVVEVAFGVRSIFPCSKICSSVEMK
ncbi:hypothetical protein ACJJIE_17095 [Microbulbifer sp. TRSA001]